MDDSRQPLFSVIVPTAGRPDLVREAVASVLAQSVADLECVVVVDGGHEEPDLPRDARVRVVPRARRGGPAAARNTGIADARGRYVTFLDDDDLLTPDRLEVALEGLALAPLALCWSARMGHPPEPGPQLEGPLGDRILDGLVPHIGTTAMARDVVPAFDERYPAVEDVEWWLRLALALPATTVPRHAYLMRTHEGERVSAKHLDWLAGTDMLLEHHAEYFATHGKAAAFRLTRVGTIALRAGDRRVARRALARSFVTRPSLTAGVHLARSVLGLTRAYR